MNELGQYRQGRLNNSTLPDWLKISISEASEKWKMSYADVGFTVAKNLNELLSHLDTDRYEQARQEWNKVQVLNQYEVRAWCRRWIPEVYLHIKQRRRRKFAEGFVDAYAANQINI